jgi:large subunit ribosomal protein L10
MPSTEKLERVAELKQRIEGANALLLAEYRGLTVAEITELRRSLRDADASLAVVKNTLMQRAAAEAGLELSELLTGPSAVAFVGGDAVTAAKQIKAAMKQFPTLVLKGGFMDGQVLSAEDANRLADLESREVMLSKVAGLLKGEMSRAASMFQSAQSRFLALLQAYEAKLPGEAEPAASVAADETPQDGGEEAPEDTSTVTAEDTSATEEDPGVSEGGDTPEAASEPGPDQAGAEEGPEQEPEEA